MGSKSSRAGGDTGPRSASLDTLDSELINVTSIPGDVFTYLRMRALPRTNERNSRNFLKRFGLGR